MGIKLYQKYHVFILCEGDGGKHYTVDGTYSSLFNACGFAQRFTPKDKYSIERISIEKIFMESDY